MDWLINPNIYMNEQHHLAEVRRAEQFSLRTHAISIPKDRPTGGNQDAHRFSSIDGFGVVCDGLGKSVSPELASSRAVAAIGARLGLLPTTESVPVTMATMRSAFGEANAAVQKTKDSRTTATAFKVVHSERGLALVYGHVGSTQLGIYSEGELRILTADNAGNGVPDYILHSLREGEAAAVGSPTRLKAALGQYIQPQFGWTPLPHDALIVLSSNGIYKNLTRAEQKAILAGGGPNKALALATKAKEFSHNGGEADDITVGVSEVIRL